MWIARRSALRLIVQASIVAVVAGCQSAPSRRSIDDICRQVATEHTRRQQEAVPLNVPASPRLLPPLPHGEGGSEGSSVAQFPHPNLLPRRNGTFRTHHHATYAEPQSYVSLAGYQSGADNDATSHTSSDLPPRLTPVVLDRLPSVAVRGGPLVNDIFEETDARQAIQSLAVQANASVILDEQVSGLTSAIIEDEPFESALRKVLLPIGCVYRKDNGQYLVGVADPESSLFPLIAERVDYDTQHLSPEELTALLPERFGKYLQVVDKRSRVVIEAPSETVEQILRDLKRADQPVPQVLLEVVVCVFSPETRLRFGFDIEQGAQVGDAFHSLSLHDLAFSGTVSPVALGGMFSDFAVTSHYLQLLAQEGYVNIRAAPRVMAKDGEKAEISIGRETYFAIQPDGAEVYFRQDIEKVEAGISLDILPIVRGDNVTVTIERAEVSEDVRVAGTGSELSSPYPLINRRRVTTTVDVKDGQTIVIGGLTQTQIVDQVNKVPFFGDMPLLGHLFRHVDKQEQEAEVVIFISPQIVTAPEPTHAAGLDDPGESGR